MLNIDWNAPKTPCQTPGCSWPNYHVCLHGKEDRTADFPDLLKPYIPGQRRSGIGSSNFNYRSDIHRARLSAGARERWAPHHAANVDRNNKIVQDYTDGLGMRELRAKYGIGHGTVVKILHDARDRGDVVIRTRGFMEYGKRVEKSA